MEDKSLFLDIGAYSIRLKFHGHGFANRASDHIYLKEQESEPVIGSIDYIQDETTQTQISASDKPNVVYIEKEDRSDGSSRVSLKMFGKYSILLDIGKENVQVRYPSNAPVNLMMDDVLQAALSPLLAKVGGFILHGSCVVRNQSAIAIMGASGSGKSTTAFNLVRFGFQCYADDAVMVVPCGKSLYVHPLAKEISLRPLAFSLLQSQGTWVNQYRKEEGKCYFKLENGIPKSAILQHVCFVRVGGENETRFKTLNREKALEVLLADKRHFSFLERHKADIYAKVVSEKTPHFIRASVGTDLKAQGRAFESVIMGRARFVGQNTCQPKNAHGRRQKKEIIRQAWSNSDSVSLTELIPLLADYDLHVLKLAFSFFQTYPLAQLEPVAMPAFSSEKPWNAEAGWLRSSQWLGGCEQLTDLYSDEVFEKFAHPWIRSAPLIYTFLKLAAAGHPAKAGMVDAAFHKFVSENKAESKARCGSLEKRILLDASGTIVPGLNVPVQLDSEDVARGGHICCLVLEGDQPARYDFDPVCDMLKQAKSIIVAPICRHACGTVDSSIAFIRQGLVYGLPVKMSRHVPLCRLSATEAAFLLDAGAFQMSGESRAFRSMFPGSPGGFAKPDISANDLALKPPQAMCFSCGLDRLGLCSGVFFR